MAEPKITGTVTYWQDDELFGRSVATLALYDDEKLSDVTDEKTYKKIMENLIIAASVPLDPERLK